MEEKQTNIIIKVRILEFEEKLMDVIELPSKYEKISIPIFEEEMSTILTESKHLERLIE